MLRALPAIFFIALKALFLAGFFTLAGPVSAQNLQTIPVLSAHVMDITNTLNEVQKQALEAKLVAFEASRGTQIVVLMVATTQPEDITDFTQRVGDSWKIGRKAIGDGLLLVVAKNDRTVRIAPAKTLEGAIPDLAARQIIDRAITPRFKQGDFAGGLNAAADQLMARISGENLPLPPEPAAQGPAGRGVAGFQWTDLAVFLFFAVPIGARLLSGLIGRKGGALATGAAVGVLAWMFTSSLLLAGGVAAVAIIFALISSLATFGGWAGRSGTAGWGGLSGGGWSSGRSGGGAGGFGSGGGGNFGGGGASGNW